MSPRLRSVVEADEIEGGIDDAIICNPREQMDQITPGTLLMQQGALQIKARAYRVIVFAPTGATLSSRRTKSQIFRRGVDSI